MENLQIEEGKFYVTRDGRKVGPAFIQDGVALFGKPNNYESAVWVDTGKANTRSNPDPLPNDIISEYKKPEIKVGDLYTFVGEENDAGCYTKGKTYQVAKLYSEEQFQMTDNFGDQHWWDKNSIESQFFPGSFDSKPQTETGVTMRTSPIQTTTVHKIISGDYGRLRVDSDGFHAVNLSISDKGRCVSVDEMRAMVEVLEELILAREG